MDLHTLAPDPRLATHAQRQQGTDRQTTPLLHTNRNLFGSPSTSLQNYRLALIRNNADLDLVPLAPAPVPNAELPRERIEVRNGLPGANWQSLIRSTPATSRSNSADALPRGSAPGTSHFRNPEEMNSLNATLEKQGGTPVKDSQSLHEPVQYGDAGQIHLAGS
ncbi:hypothetical protein R1flu_019876 [Riccia fluitans]|uniref:Uncharacterized protein n=1 Tax=Riccia fluitans TaxID=41844 RepID=A0ABD1ZJW5_9MARC